MKWVLHPGTRVGRSGTSPARVGFIPRGEGVVLRAAPPSSACDGKVPVGVCLCSPHSLHSPPCPVSSATGDREPHPQTLPEQPGAHRSRVNATCPQGLRHSGNKTVDPELGKPSTGFKGSSWTDGGRELFPKETNKPSVQNLKDFAVLF